MSFKERYCMNLVREVLRLKFDKKLSNRLIGSSVGISKSTVATYLERATSAGLTSQKNIQELTDEELKEKIFPFSNLQEINFNIDFNYIRNELKRNHVTLKLIWKEEKEKNKDLCNYSHYCDLYKKWKNDQKISMKQTYQAGEKMFIDYAGTTMPITNSKTGEIRSVQIFIGVLGQSNYTYIEATESQSSKDFINSHINAFKFFGGCPKILVPDNLKSGVTATCKYEPSINKSYRAMADHYGAVVVPARVRKPKDKAKVEGGVLIASRWILAALRNRVFFSLDELNNAIWELLDKYNDEEFQVREGSRKSNFDDFEKNALMKLPQNHHEVAEWKNVKSNIDYHIEVDHCYYSVHYKFRNCHLTVRYTDSSVEIFSNNHRIAVHRRISKRGSRSTIPDHMPKTHREYADWSPSRIINWAEKIGPHVKNAVELLLNKEKHPELSFRSCLGIIRLEKYYAKERVDNACKRAIEIKGISFKSIKSILEKGLDSQQVSKEEDTQIQHENIRGSDYFH